MQANEDDVFNHEIAKRSVARAALHLGIDHMTEEALDVMGDVLLSYMQRVGRTLSQMVESSGRTSAHVNVLDALRAIEMCTSVPAVRQLHFFEEGQDTETTQPSDEEAVVGWKDLAVFLFGSDWMKQETIQPETGGKVGPSSSSDKKETGWYAPYLDEIPNYPRASQACANPHRLDRSDVLSLYGQMPSPTHEGLSSSHEAALAEMPDDAFTTDWGSIVGLAGSDNNEKKKKAEGDHEDAPPTKRVKIHDEREETAVTERAKEKNEKPQPKDKPKESHAAPRPAYVPSFLPPFPKSGPGRAIAITDDVAVLPQAAAPPAPDATVVETSSSSTTTDPLDVRSSLVNMKHSYWGSGWDFVTAPPAKVPAGRRPPTEKEKEKAERQKVAPLERPSLSRTSRILEGSMDAAT